jgi:hypothetical protein
MRSDTFALSLIKKRGRTSGLILRCSTGGLISRRQGLLLCIYSTSCLFRVVISKVVFYAKPTLSLPNTYNIQQTVFHNLDRACDGYSILYRDTLLYCPVAPGLANAFRSQALSCPVSQYWLTRMARGVTIVRCSTIAVASSQVTVRGQVRFSYSYWIVRGPSRRRREARLSILLIIARTQP